MEDSWSPPGRTSPGAASPLVRESRELQWALPQSQRSQHRTTAGATPDPDLVWGFVGRRCNACCPAWRWLDANHGSGRAGAAEAGGVEGTAPVVRTRSCDVRYRGVATHA